MPMLRVLCLAIIVSVAIAEMGVDVSVSVSEKTKFGILVAHSSTRLLECLKSQGFNFTVVRAYRSLGRVDTNAIDTIKNAWKAGMGWVDAYLFPCYKCGNPVGQSHTTVDYLRNNSAPFHTIWLDIEGASQYWSTNQDNNRQFFNSLVQGLRDRGVQIGIYSGLSQWSVIMGTSFTAGSEFPLWYAHYDHKPSFSDFKPFAGWAKPYAKQFDGDVTACGIGLDKNWIP